MYGVFEVTHNCTITTASFFFAEQSAVSDGDFEKVSQCKYNLHA